MNNKLYDFIRFLSITKVSTNVFNQYSFELPINAIRRDNLYLYLQQISMLCPQILLVGEAPGYRGCRLTGVPFTSEYILLQGIEELGLFGKSRGYSKTDEGVNICKEQTATIVWQTLIRFKHIPLFWNAFPFHPWQFNNEQSNRTPNKAELKLGQDFLNKLILMFEIKTIIALGNKAEASIQALGLPYYKVRHPANGGKPKFTSQLEAVMDFLSNN